MVTHLSKQMNNLLYLLLTFKLHISSLEFAHYLLKRQLHRARKLNIVDQIIDHFHIISQMGQDIFF
ncbi:hypothetical protein D3C76_1314950 [compost metagenome]